MMRPGFAILVLLSLLPAKAGADSSDPPKSARPFDRYRAIFAIGVQSVDADWTIEAREYLLSEISRRAGEEKLLVSTDNNLTPEKFRADNKLEMNQVIYLIMTFEDSKSVKGRVNFTLNAQNFYIQGAVFEPGTSFAKAKPFLDRMLNGFFEYGEGK